MDSGIEDILDDSDDDGEYVNSEDVTIHEYYESNQYS
jgi:hypothetical protein